MRNITDCPAPVALKIVPRESFGAKSIFATFTFRAPEKPHISESGACQRLHLIYAETPWVDRRRDSVNAAINELVC